MRAVISHNDVFRAGDSPASMRPQRLAGPLWLAVFVSTLLSTQVFAGGADVSEDEIYADGVTLTTMDGEPLDIDGDGNVDLAIAANRGETEQSSRYYLGNGDGTFSEPVLLTSGASSRVVAADLNGDTFIDLVQGRRDRRNILYLGTGAGDVDAGTDISADANRTLGVAIGDLDLDDDLDIVMSNGRRSGSEEAQANRFYLNDLMDGGTTTFTGSDILADLDETRSVALADLDGDLDLDVIVGNDHTTPAANHIYLNEYVENGSTTLSFAPAFQFDDPDELTTEVLVGDLDNDGRPDIVVLNAVVDGVSTGVNRFFLNATEGTFDLGPPNDVSADTDRTNGGDLADFDGDGDLDLAVANFVANDSGQSSRNRLYLNQFTETGTVSFAAAIDISTDEHMSHELAAADLNDDGHIDIVVGNRNNVPNVPGHDRRYLNNGTGEPFANVAPVIDAQAADLETNEQTELTIELDHLEISDADNVIPDDFTLTVQDGDNYTVADNTITPDAGFSGDLSVPVTVDDGTDESEPFNVTVAVSGGGPANSPPAFTSDPVEEGTEGNNYTYEVAASDPDDDSLTITALTLPDWLTLSDNGDGTATLSGTPDADDVGDHEVSLEVSDSTSSATQNFTVAIQEAADEPPPPPDDPGSSGGGGGGALGLWSLVALAMYGMRFRRRRRHLTMLA